MRERGLLMMVTGPDALRAVLHLQVTRADVAVAVKIISRVLSDMTVPANAEN